MHSFISEINKNKKKNEQKQNKEKRHQQYGKRTKSEDEDAADQDEGKGLTRRDGEGKEYKDEQNKGEDGRRKKKKNNNKNNNHYNNNNENMETLNENFVKGCLVVNDGCLETGQGTTEKISEL